MNITSTFTTHARIITLAALVLIIPIQGCASSSTRSKADSKTAHPEIDPTLAYIQNRRSDAIKHYNTASALDLDGKPDEALEEYRRALELDDKLYAAWNNMGRILMSKGKYADGRSLILGLRTRKSDGHKNHSIISNSQSNATQPTSPHCTASSVALKCSDSVMNKFWNTSVLRNSAKRMTNGKTTSLHSTIA